MYRYWYSTVVVAVEDGKYVVELVIDDVIECFGDLAFARFTVTDDAVDALIDAIKSSGLTESCSRGQSLAERSGRRVEEQESFTRVGMTIERRLRCTE